MRISAYDLIDSSFGGGYADDPYEFFNLYVRGDASVSWTVVGSGKFAINLSDMQQRVYEEDVAYHAISVYVNGILAKADTSLLTETKNFGLTLDLTGDKSEVELVFNSNLGKTENLTYIRKLSSFLLEKNPIQPVVTTTVEPFTGLTSEEEIKASGVRIASVDFEAVCGAYRIKLAPDTGEFHLINGEIWFTGDRSVEREYLVRVIAVDMNDVVIGSKSLNLLLAACHSSSACILVEDENGVDVPTRGDGSPGSGSGSSSGSSGSGTDDEVVEELSPPTNLSAVVLSCGPKSDVVDVDTIWATTAVTWSPNNETLFDVLISRGNTFNLVDVQYYSISQQDVHSLLLADTTYFLRVRSRSPESAKVSEWSDVLMFETTTDGTCDTPQIEPEPPESTPILCRERVPPSGPEEKPGTAPEETPKTPDEKPEKPTPEGPSGCFGNGCGDNNPDNPNNPSPNPPGSYPNNPNNPGGCIGPGCSPGSEPQPPGTGGGGGGEGEGNPGGPTEPSPNPPSVPTPQVPVCFDDKIHSSYIDFTNKGDASVTVKVRLTELKNASCVDYIKAIGKKDNQLVDERTVGAGENIAINIKEVCPECIEICVTSSPDGVPFDWKIMTAEYDDDGNLGTPYEIKSTSETSVLSCDCGVSSPVNSFDAQTYSENGINETTTMTLIDMDNGRRAAMTRALDPATEGCFQIKQTRTGGGILQERAKVICLQCAGGREWVDITDSVIACHVGFFKRFARPNDNNDAVSYQNHWLMSGTSYQFTEHTWPDTTEVAWNITSNPYRTTWDFDGKLCVTCCETDVNNLGDTIMVINSAINGDTAASTPSINYPFNNVKCIDGVVDPHMGGVTGFIQHNNPHQGEHTLSYPCSSPFVTAVDLHDGEGTVADTFYSFKIQHGYAPVTLQDIDNIGTTSCEGNGSGDDPYRCSLFAVNADYSYTQHFEYVNNGCQYKNGEDANAYSFSPNTVAFQISAVSLAGFSNDCEHADAAIGNGSFTQKGRSPNQLVGSINVPFGNDYTPGNDWWNENGFRYSVGGTQPDGTTYNSGRYSADIVLSPIVSGGGSNPLP